ncbi:MAG: carboxymuconolactone decarboxylase family protein [Trebonia sp.]
MTRVPLRELDGAEPGTVAAFRSFERENRAPIDLYRALANAPGLLNGFHELSDALRYRGRVPRLLRELAILRTAYLTGSEYEWSHHVGMALAAGIEQPQVAGIGRWPDSSAFGAVERAVLRLADEMHAGQVSDATFTAVAAATSTEEATELVVLLGHYQGVARIIQALGVQTEPAYAAAASWHRMESPR